MYSTQLLDRGNCEFKNKHDKRNIPVQSTSAGPSTKYVTCRLSEPPPPLPWPLLSRVASGHFNNTQETGGIVVPIFCYLFIYFLIFNR